MNFLNDFLCNKLFVKTYKSISYHVCNNTKWILKLVLSVITLIFKLILSDKATLGRKAFREVTVMHVETNSNKVINNQESYNRNYILLIIYYIHTDIIVCMCMRKETNIYKAETRNILLLAVCKFAVIFKTFPIDGNFFINLISLNCWICSHIFSIIFIKYIKSYILWQCLYILIHFYSVVKT